MTTTSSSGISQSVDDPAFLARLRDGDESAFEVLVRTQAGAMLRAARGLLGNDDDAREVVQEASLSVFRAIARFQGDCKLSTWIHRVTVNAALMRLRSSRRRPAVSVDALLPQFDDGGQRLEPPCPRGDAPEVAIGTERRAKVREAIDMLPDTHRVVLLMRDIEERSTEEVAGLLGITPNAVKIRLHRARQALRTLLVDKFEVLAP